MDEQSLNYGRMMQRALRSLMAEALGITAEYGLSDDHHFYIAFDTTHPGVDMPAWLRSENPEDLTIVLQYEFDDLGVLGDRFTVKLSFHGRPAVLVVPFDAVKTFADPSVEFGLRFESHHDEWEDEEPSEDADVEHTAPHSGSADVVRLDTFRKT